MAIMLRNNSLAMYMCVVVSGVSKQTITMLIKLHIVIEHLRSPGVRIYNWPIAAASDKDVDGVCDQRPRLQKWICNNRAQSRAQTRDALRVGTCGLANT